MGVEQTAHRLGAPGPRINGTTSQPVSKSRALTVTKKPPKRRPPRRWPRRLVRLALVLVVLGGLGGAGLMVKLHPDLFSSAAGDVGGVIIRATGWAGLSVRDALVEGRQKADRKQVMAALQIDRGVPILGYDAEATRLRLEAVPWVQSAVVERRLPDTIYVRLTERQPLALWQHGGKFSVIDVKGVVVVDGDVSPYAKLPLVVGQDAPAAAEALLLMLDTEPDLKPRVTAAVRVAGRRWTLRLDNRVDVKLPEEDAATSWSELAKLEREQKLLERDIVAIDFRLGDRLMVQLSPEAAAQLHVSTQSAGNKPGAAKPAPTQTTGTR